MDFCADMMGDEADDPFAVGVTVSPVSWRPLDRRSIQSLPSGLSITSTIEGSPR